MTSLDTGRIATSGGAQFLGQRRYYWRLLIRGAVLLMVTLGIYRFWLVTDVRRFLWSNTEIAGEALEYTGTALELLLGFLVAIALLIPVYAGFFWRRSTSVFWENCPASLPLPHSVFLDSTPSIARAGINSRALFIAACAFIRKAQPGVSPSARCCGGS